MNGLPKKAPGAGELTGRQTNYGGLYRFLRVIQRPGCAFCWAIEWCSQIEIARELDKWNRDDR